MYGFEKDERTNISDKERDALRMMAKDLLGLTAGFSLFSVPPC